MRKIILFVFMCLMASVKAISTENDEESVSTLFSEDINLINLDVLESRTPIGGTRIVPIFSGEWTPAQQGAFKIACELWEDVIPTSLPLIIEANMIKQNHNASSKSVLTKVRIKQQIADIGYTSTPKYNSTMTKHMAYRELTGYSESGYSFALDSLSLTKPDISIDFYLYDNMDDIYSYSLDATSITDKYDFITCAMRCIGTGLGISWTQRKINKSAEELPVDYQKITPYENIILSSLGTDNHQRYLNATQGTLSINTSNNTTYNIYAPNEWDKDLSLNYFIPSNDKKITQLMGYNFAKGYVVRDLSDTSISSFFRSFLGWNDIITIGISNSDIPKLQEFYSSTQNAIAYGDDINCEFNSTTYSTSETVKNRIHRRTSNNYLFNYNQEVNEKIITFHPNYRLDGSINQDGWTVALQKKDGSWDIVYDDPNCFSSLNINQSSLQFHEPIDNYARNYNGYYKCRISHYNSFQNNAKVRTKYIMLKTLPQKALILPQKSKFVSGQYEDAFAKTVKIEMGNLEGVTSVSVLQLNDGANIPYQFDVENFKDGYFFAIVDKEFDTFFTITYFNENGSSQKSFVFHPTTNMDNSTPISFYREDNVIHVRGGQLKEASLISLSNMSPIIQCSHDNNEIKIGDLQKGTYSLNVVDTKGTHANFKFSK